MYFIYIMDFFERDSDRIFADPTLVRGVECPSYQSWYSQRVYAHEVGGAF